LNLFEFALSNRTWVEIQSVSALLALQSIVGRAILAMPAASSCASFRPVVSVSRGYVGHVPTR
jgi:hypothetical protein